MKVLLINGSPKEHGNTFLALSEVANTLNAEGIETEIVSIGKQAVQGCIACGWCGSMADQTVHSAPCSTVCSIPWDSSCSTSLLPVWWYAVVVAHLRLLTV